MAEMVSAEAVTFKVVARWSRVVRRNLSVLKHSSHAPMFNVTVEAGGGIMLPASI